MAEVLLAILAIIDKTLWWLYIFLQMVSRALTRSDWVRSLYWGYFNQLLIDRAYDCHMEGRSLSSTPSKAHVKRDNWLEAASKW
jgi:hypothetical protein